MSRKLIPLLIALALVLSPQHQALDAQPAMMHRGPAPATLTFPEGKEVVEVPFELIRDKILIPVRVNGSEPLRFVLDTGAPVSVLMESKRAQSLDLDIVGEAMVGGAGEGETRSVPIAGGVEFDLAGIKITGATMAIGVGEGVIPTLGWDGVIGRPVFKNLVVDVDFSRRIMRLYRPDRFDYDGPGEELPLTLAGGSFPFVMARVSIDGRDPVEASLVIDTGAGHALSLSIEAQDHIRAPEHTISSVLGWGANGVLHGRVGRITKLELGSYSLDDLVVSFPSSKGMPSISAGGAHRSVALRGNMGIRTLKRFRAIFDYANERLILEPNGDYKAPSSFNTVGVIPRPWVSGAASIEVVDIIASSPAEEAGFELGDRITAFDGKPVEALGVDEIRDLMEGAPGSKLTLTIHRGSEELNKVVTLRKLI